MKTRKMRNLRKSIVAGFAAFMLLAESMTAFACPAEAHVEECAQCEEEHDGCGEVILYDAQFVDMDGNITPARLGSERVICPGHYIVPGYYQTHVKNGNGGCTVKTYEGTKCVVCSTIWLGDLYAKTEYAKCPH